MKPKKGHRIFFLPAVTVSADPSPPPRTGTALRAFGPFGSRGGRRSEEAAPGGPSHGLRDAQGADPRELRQAPWDAFGRRLGASRVQSQAGGVEMASFERSDLRALRFFCFQFSFWAKHGIQGVDPCKPFL